LPPRAGWDALQAALADWRGGRTSWEHWGDSTEAARAGFARLAGLSTEEVAIGSTVSGLVGFVAASLTPGSRVVMPDVEFTSMLFPFLVQEELGRCEVTLVPPAQLAEAIDETTEVAAFSAVQMSTGEVADLAAIAAAAHTHGVFTVCDATQACGWLPLDVHRFDVLAVSAYKWLMSPRGTAFLGVRRERLADVVPVAAGWYAAEDIHDAYCGLPMLLAPDARRLDTSPAWFSWVGTQPALELVERIGVDAIHEHDVALANRFRAGLGLRASDSAIVTADLPGAAERLERAGIVAAMREGRLRASWHVYNTADEVDHVLDVLIG
jgi:selenocysteine lyase/cysteine desulfurase